MKPFDIELAKKGHPVCTRDGRKVRILCFDRKGSYYHIVALVEDISEKEEVVVYPDTGRYDDSRKSEDDLMLYTEMRTGYINVYNERVVGPVIYKTEEEARKFAEPSVKETIKIEYSK